MYFHKGAKCSGAVPGIGRWPLLVGNKISNGRREQMASYCVEGLGWTLLESTDALLPLEEFTLGWRS